MIKVLINFNEGKKDYVECWWYEGLASKPFKKIEYNKPASDKDYNHDWKQGLYQYQHELIEAELGDKTIIDL